MSEEIIQDQAYWQRHVDQYKTSGLSKRAYAKQEGLILGRWMYWTKKLMKPSSAFLPVNVKGASPVGTALMRVDTPQGFQLSIYDGRLLRELPKLLAALPK